MFMKSLTLPDLARQLCSAHNFDLGKTVVPLLSPVTSIFPEHKRTFLVIHGIPQGRFFFLSQISAVIEK